MRSYRRQQLGAIALHLVAALRRRRALLVERPAPGGDEGLDVGRAEGLERKPRHRAQPAHALVGAGAAGDEVAVVATFGDQVLDHRGDAPAQRTGHFVETVEEQKAAARFYAPAQVTLRQTVAVTLLGELQVAQEILGSIGRAVVLGLVAQKLGEAAQADENRQRQRRAQAELPLRVFGGIIQQAAGEHQRREAQEGGLARTGIADQYGVTLKA